MVNEAYITSVTLSNLSHVTIFSFEPFREFLVKAMFLMFSETIDCKCCRTYLFIYLHADIY